MTIEHTAFLLNKSHHSLFTEEHYTILPLEKENSMVISKKIAVFLSRGSMIRRLFEEGAKMKADGSALPVYDFSIGNPDLDPPAEFYATIKQLIEYPIAGQHKYMSNAGYHETRTAVAGSFEREYALPFTADHVIMTVGAGGALNILFKAILDEGDEIIASAPYFVEYDFYVQNHGGVLKTVPSTKEFNLSVEAIEGAITSRTRAVIITNPGNPTGIVYPQETLDELGAMLRRASEKHNRPIYLIDDAPYRKLVYDMPRCTSAFSAYDYTVMGTSHSKDLGLPGERIGFLVLSPHIVESVLLAEACAFTSRTLGFVNAPAMAQRAVAALQDVTIDLEWYRRKRDRLYNALTEIGYEVGRGYIDLIETVGEARDAELDAERAFYPDGLL